MFETGILGAAAQNCIAYYFHVFNYSLDIPNSVNISSLNVKNRINFDSFWVLKSGPFFNFVYFDKLLE